MKVVSLFVTCIASEKNAFTAMREPHSGDAFMEEYLSNTLDVYRVLPVRKVWPFNPQSWAPCFNAFSGALPASPK
ncbi:hypothetical protein thsrh120_56970 [Rhizobium sp. No.120]